MQYVRVEVSEGRAYTYTWDDRTGGKLQKGERVVLPSNIVQEKTFEGTVLRTISAEDVAKDSYQGPYKEVLRRVEDLL